MMTAQIETEELRLIVDASERFAREQLADQGHNGQSAGFPLEQLQAAQGAGFLHAPAPEQAGGIGLDVYGQTILLSKLAQGSAGFATIVATHLAALGGLASAPAETIERLIGHEDDKLLGLAFPEWTAGGARLDGGKLSGQLIAPVGPDRCGALGLLIPSRDGQWQSHFVSVDNLPWEGLPSHCGSGLDTLTPIRLRFDEVELQQHAVLPASQCHPGNRIMSEYKLLLAAVQVGNAAQALDDATVYATERKQTGRFIVDHQNIRAMLCNMQVLLSAAQSLVEKAASQTNRHEGHFDLCRQAHCFAATVCEQICLDAVQVLGGYGYMKDYPLERRLRDCKSLQGLTADHLFDSLGVVVQRQA